MFKGSHIVHLFGNAPICASTRLRVQLLQNPPLFSSTVGRGLAPISRIISRMITGKGNKHDYEDEE
jgi:hypothetical protein